MPEARTVSGIEFHLPGVHIPHQVGSQILVLQLPHFLHPPTQNSKDLEKVTNSCDPYARKATGGPREPLSHISAVCPLWNPRETHLCSCPSNHQPIAPSGARRFLTREVDLRPGHQLTQEIEDSFSAKDSRSCVCRPHSSLRHCMASWPHLQAAAIVAW